LAAAIRGGAQATPLPHPEEASVVMLSLFAVNLTKDSAYGAASAGSSDRLNQRDIDTPQITSVATSRQIGDVALFRPIDVLEFVNQVRSRTPAHRPGYVIGGLYPARNYAEGFCGRTQIDSDPIFAGRFDVVKGPGSGSFGRGETAGMVHFIRAQTLFRTS